MAKLGGECVSLFLYFVIVLRISFVSTENDYYYYDNSHQNFDKEHIELKFIETGNPHIHRRGAGDQPVNSTLHDNLTINVTPTPKPISSKVPNNSYVQITNLTKLWEQPTPVTILGANGAGQRKYSTIPGRTTVPPRSTGHPSLHNTNTTTTIVKKNDTSDFDQNIVLPKFDEKDLNKTLSQHNIKMTRNDSHIYYNSSFKTNTAEGEHYWVNLTNLDNVTTHDILSSAYRRAATVTLSFEFPFYGHLLKKITVATGGFLYTGDYVHSWLAATQYIAPLMANFDTGLSNDSYIRYHDNGSAFTVEWERASLHDRPKDGEFTFQTTLLKNGDIIFVYKQVPLIIESIQDDEHPVKVGLSDAYIIDSTIFFVRRKTIYEYHRVNFRKEDIGNWTVIYLSALPTCLESLDCISCLTKEVQRSQCVWCPTLRKCSSGVDRDRHNWILSGCDQSQIKNESTCSRISGYDIFNDNDTSYSHDVREFENALESQSKPTISRVLGLKQPVKLGISGTIAIFFLSAMVAGVFVWVMYAYRNPHTTSGQILIRYRPSQWRWKRGEARYTAATIHM